MKEDLFVCVPSFKISSLEDGSPVYKVHQPTCCAGCCVAGCCAECDCCGICCCCTDDDSEVPFHIYPADQENTDDDAPFIGKMLKTDAEAFDLTFPDDATAQEKGLLMGSTIFINVNSIESPFLKDAAKEVVEGFAEEMCCSC